MTTPGSRLDRLRTVPAFAGLGELELIALAARTQDRTFEAGETLMRQGDPGDALWVIVGGAAVVRLRYRGGSSVELAFVGPGDVVGEMALVTGSPRNADVVATAPGAALSLARSDFDAVAGEHPGVVGVLTELMAARLGRAAQDGLGDKVIEGFRILRPVGRGATAVVYEAEQVAAPSAGAPARRTALKMLSHRFSRDASVMASFERESALLDAVSHEAIARGYGRFDAYGTRFLAIEYVDGPSAQEILTRIGGMPVADALAVAGTVAAALNHVHARGILHRDVKPANVMVARDGRVVLTDFGIASRVGPEGESSRLCGTPRYMAPELFVGSKPGPSTDLYALGCVLHELLTGTPLFGAADLGLLVLTKRRFDGVHADDLPAGVPAHVRTLLGRLLHADPARRPADAGSLGLSPGRVSLATVEETLRRRA